MKALPETELFTVTFGSHLYGTNGPTSDLDFKVVCLPSLDDLLLNKKVTNRKVTPSGEEKKMQAGEAEYEYIPLQVLFSDFINGQTYAVEIAFAVLAGKFTTPTEDAESRKMVFELMQTLVEEYLTKNVKKMVGYAIAQSRIYGVKTERFATVKSAVAAIENFFGFENFDVYKVMTKMSVGDATWLREKLLTIPHISSTMIENAKGGTALAPAIDVCGKMFPHTARWSTVYDSLKNTLDNYGERVKRFEGQGVDWKALSHAIRITEQIIELCLYGHLIFPRPNAVFLKQIKEGNAVSVDFATSYLEEQFNKIDEAVNASQLRERTTELDEQFKVFQLTHLRKLYSL